MPILMYHSISRSAQPRFAKFVVTPELFAEHLDYLDEQGFNSMTVSQYVLARRDGGDNLPQRPVLLTVDDGFADFYCNALPLLKRHGFTATLYAVTGYIGATSGWLRREGESRRAMLTWAQLREVCAHGIECGAHTHTHRPLDTLPREAAYDEMHRSKALLEDHLGRQVLSFAYPYGFYTASVRALVQQASFASACAVRYRLSSPADDTYALARLLMSAQTDVRTLAALLGGRQPLGMPQMMQMRTHLWRYVRLGAVGLGRLAGEGRVAG